jgi:hypothetical protein
VKSSVLYLSLVPPITNFDPSYPAVLVK